MVLTRSQVKKTAWKVFGAKRGSLLFRTTYRTGKVLKEPKAICCSCGFHAFPTKEMAERFRLVFQEDETNGEIYFVLEVKAFQEEDRYIQFHGTFPLLKIVSKTLYIDPLACGCPTIPCEHTISGNFKENPLLSNQAE